MSAGWITAHRERLGMDTLQFARALSALGAKQRDKVRVSEILLLILETRDNAVTHPLIANLIARACGATPEQRDGIVAEKHRRHWHGVDAPALDAKTANPWRTQPAVAQKVAHEWGMRPVAVVDRWGMVLRVFQTIGQAAQNSGLSKQSIADRCRRKTRCEFRGDREFTYRFADEWLAMTPQAREAEMREIASRVDVRDNAARKQIVVVDANANVLRRWQSLYETSKQEDVHPCGVRDRCKRRTAREFASANDVTYRYAEEWDAMTREQQMRDIALARGKV